MPGLFGIISTSQKADKNAFYKLAYSIKPSNIEPQISFHDSALLGFKSLGIIDPKQQPFTDSKHNLKLFIWGEIYDYPNKNIPVADYVFKLYLNDDLDKLKDLNGCYSFALWDNGRKKLVLASDIYATRPIYYYQEKDLLYFSPSALGLAQALQLKKINQSALIQFLQTSLITGTNTWVENVCKLSPGSYLVYANGKISQHKYYIPKFTPENISVFNSASGIVEHLKTAITRYKKERFSLSLSGGGDSRLVAALCKQVGYEFKTFTFSGEKSRDRDIARIVSRKLELVHYPLLISPDYLPDNIYDAVYNTNGFSSAINFHGISTRTEVRKLAGLAISGLYGNNFLGYMSFAIQKFSLINEQKKFVKQLSAWINSGFHSAEIKHLTDTGEFETTENISSDLIKKYQQDSYLNTLFAIDHFEINSQRTLCGFWLENDTVEYRTPFCDYDLLKFNLTIPARHKLLMQIGREIWRTHFTELGKITYQRTELPISAPVSMIAIKKMMNKLVQSSAPPGIIDYDQIFRGELSGWINVFLTGDSALNGDYLNREKVKAIIADHQKNKADNTMKIGLLLTFEQVLRILSE